MGKKSQPKAPDPYKTADAQGAMNRDTAIAQSQLNMVNQTGPWGSVSFDQTGTTADGIPQYTATTSLSPSQRFIYNRGQAAQKSLSIAARDQSKFLSKYLGQGIDLSGIPKLRTQVGAGYDSQFSGDLGADFNTSYAGADDFAAMRRRVEDALWKRTAGDRASNDEALRAKLTAQGIRPGSAAWDSEMQRLGRQNTDARLATIAAGGEEQQRLVNMSRDAAIFGNDAILQRAGFGLTAQQAQNQAVLAKKGFTNQARSQGISEALALRNQPINEIMALLGGTQVSNPTTMGASTPQTGIGGVDLAGLVGQKYAADLSNYQQNMGGLFGLGGSLLGAAGNAGGFAALFSDRRLKEDIRRVGETDGGTPIYTYRYKDGGPVQMGVMAQDVPEVAIEHPSGYLMVDYSRVH